MKKVLFLMFLLLLMGLGAASVKAQVRIGGNTPPNPAAALDLNADDSATPAGNKGALALPRVSLASTTDKLNGATPITGMLVYNTNASMTNGFGVGMYFWDSGKWVKVALYAPVMHNEITWVQVLDSIVDVPPIPANTYVVVDMPGIPDLSFCITEGTTLNTTSTNMIIYFQPYKLSPGGPTRTTCYAPTPRL